MSKFQRNRPSNKQDTAQRTRKCKLMISGKKTPIDITRKLAKFGLIPFNRIFDRDDVIKMKNKSNNTERILFQL